ncbi:MAG: purine-nucleoside phosphorylase [Lachnospiraceae bacterium]|nr:purine-nucleoside phosphorylase [Lachnospiraceae bacterium]MCR5086439.1 purine-nucleoside phosphorylase [Lachnospiraceae bacterium]
MGNNYPTPHIACKPEDFAKTVLMPGDPLRAEFIAKTFLKDAVLVNNVRGIQGYTGTYDGVRVSVMASGMGIPSIGIYSYELYNFFGVENIIRIGSAGAYSPDVRVRDIVIAQGACYDSNYAEQFNLPGTFSAISDYTLLSTAVESAKELGLRYHVGNLVSSDRFYGDPEAFSAAEQPLAAWGKMGVLAVEMEAAGLFMNAARAGKRALAICTISDHLITGENLPAQERQTSFTEMMELALSVAVKMK